MHFHYFWLIRPLCAVVAKWSLASNIPLTLLFALFHLLGPNNVYLFLLSVVAHGVQPRKHPRGTAAHLNPILDHCETSPGTSQKTTSIKSWYKHLPDIILVGALRYCLIDDCMLGVICIKMYLLLVHRLPRRCTVHICIL